tara:strand:+ start:2575 stop:2757 length:183 start_codon:yes stop_codon:yes gene_type:complete
MNSSLSRMKLKKSLLAIKRANIGEPIIPAWKLSEGRIALGRNGKYFKVDNGTWIPFNIDS